MLILMYLSDLVGDWCRFLFFHVERVPDPVPLMPDPDGVGLFLHDPNRASLRSFHNPKARVFSSVQRDGEHQSGQKPQSPQLEPSHHLGHKGRGKEGEKEEAEQTRRSH